MFDLKQIQSTENEQLRNTIQQRLDNLTKPVGSLGRLEELAMQYCLCKKTADAQLNKMAIYTFAGDHGITDEGVCPYPKEVTQQMILNMVTGGAAVSVMAKAASIPSYVVDVGVAGKFDPHPLLLDRKVALGTMNFLYRPAMSAQQCEKAIDAGFSLAKESKVDLLGIGEMGIGNSTSASALYSMLFECDADSTVGAGTGSKGAMLARKKEVVSKAVVLHKKEWDGSALDALARLGGYEIAAMTGMILGGAVTGVPVVVDGFISCVAALVAMQIAPSVSEYCIFSHVSAERFHEKFFRLAGIKPILNLDMRLGEGTGSVLAMQIVKQAMTCYHEMATFSSAGVSEA